MFFFFFLYFTALAFDLCKRNFFFGSAVNQFCKMVKKWDFRKQLFAKEESYSLRVLRCVLLLLDVDKFTDESISYLVIQ